MKSINERPKEKEIYIWNIAGSVANALASVFFLITVTRIAGEMESDIFSLGWSIAQLVMTIGTFQVRLYQATDVQGAYSLRQYVYFRYLTLAAMIVAALGYVGIYGYRGEKAAVVLSLTVYKAVEAYADVYQGWMQLKERLDLAGKGLFFRSVLSFAGFTGILAATQSLTAACGSMILLSLGCLWLFEFRYMKKGNFIDDVTLEREKNFLWRLLVTCLPLFLNSFLVMSIFNAPKMAIDQAMGAGVLEQGAQTVYGILFMPASVINLVYLVFRPVITKMALMWEAGRKKEYLKLIVQVTASLAGLSVFILLGGYFLGIPVLSLLYHVDLTNQREALLILLLAGGLNTLVNVLDNALTVIRRQYVLLTAYVLSWAAARIAAPRLVTVHGIIGAAWSFLLSMAVLLAAVLFLFCTYMKKEAAGASLKKRT